MNLLPHLFLCRLWAGRACAFQERIFWIQLPMAKGPYVVESSHMPFAYGLVEGDLMAKDSHKKIFCWNLKAPAVATFAHGILTVFSHEESLVLQPDPPKNYLHMETV